MRALLDRDWRGAEDLVVRALRVRPEMRGGWRCVQERSLCSKGVCVVLVFFTWTKTCVVKAPDARRLEVVGVRFYYTHFLTTSIFSSLAVFAQLNFSFLLHIIPHYIY